MNIQWHYTLHILLNLASNNFDIIFRKGRLPFTAIEGQTERFTLANKFVVDGYIEQFQKTMAIEGCSCVGDVSNPTVLSQPPSAYLSARPRPPHPAMVRPTVPSPIGAFTSMIPPATRPPPPK